MTAQTIHGWMLVGCVALLNAATAAIARDYYVTPDGAGNRDGAQWASALPQDKLQVLLSETLEPGDRVLLGSGDYTKHEKGTSTLLRITRSGTSEKPLTIEGVDTGDGLPRLVGKWSHANVKYHAHSWSAVSLDAGVSHLRLANLRIVNWMHGITTGGDHTGLTVDAVDVDACREAIVLQGVAASTLRNSRLTHYTKKGIAFDKGCVGIRVEAVVADATGGDAEWTTEAFPFGFCIGDGPGNRDIEYLRCVARNNMHPGEPSAYWNGDGFVTEAPAESIRYTECIAIDNCDAGFDDKSKASVFTGCIAVRNKRNFRVWNARGSAEEPSRLVRCVGAYAERHGGRSDFVGLWVGGAVVAERCTFHANLDHAVSISHVGSLIARNCLLTAADAEAKGTLVKREKGTTYTAESTVEWPADGVDPPRYRAASPDWTGDPRDALVSERYAPQVGFVTDGD